MLTPYSNTSVVGYPRIGTLRELKFAEEKYFRGEIDAATLQETARNLRATHWKKQRTERIGFIPSNDFSLYDGMLDTAVLLNAVPERFKNLGISGPDTYFAMARGYQGPQGDVKALAMKKWFDTNYHYMVPEIEDSTEIALCAGKPLSEYLEAKALGIETKPVVIGAFTFLKLARFTGSRQAPDIADDVAAAYAQLLGQLSGAGVAWVQIDEPALVRDLTPEDISLFVSLYEKILTGKGNAKVLLQIYFGDVRDCYGEILSLPFDGIGLDFVMGKKSLALVEGTPFPGSKTLFAGVVNGRNIWKNDYRKTVQLLKRLQAACGEIVVGTSCSLLHVPYTLKNEDRLPPEHAERLAFAEEKLTELTDLDTAISEGNPEDFGPYRDRCDLFAKARGGQNERVREAVAKITPADCIRLPAFKKRERIQKKLFALPPLPTTTIGSFPQTADVKAKRSAFKKGTISEEEYTAFIRGKIAACVKWQEETGLDVLVHGEYERNDMVEYFGECLDGFLFTSKAWVQSYGTRCVKPPIVWGDISRKKPMTVEWSVYAQSLTDRPMKGMLTGPVTILNWSFPREDIPLRECTMQIALAIRAEVLDLEANGIRIIQIDEAALREKLPLRRSDWKKEYLDWAIPAFRLVHSGCRAETQIHTHMCYSEFTDIIDAIDDMDADVITFEASRSDLQILDALQACGFRTEVGPGVYDIHSPRVPSVEEIEDALRKMLSKLPASKLWVNPDCGLKTRGVPETEQSLKNIVQAAKNIRAEIE